MFVAVHTAALTRNPGDYFHVTLWVVLGRKKVVTQSPVKKIYCFMVSYLCLDTWAIVVWFPGSLSHSKHSFTFQTLYPIPRPLSESKTLSLIPRPSLGIGSQCSGTCLEWSLFKVATSLIWFPAALILYKTDLQQPPVCSCQNAGLLGDHYRQVLLCDVILTHTQYKVTSKKWWVNRILHSCTACVQQVHTNSIAYSP